ncbi:MAG: Histidine--tRNA ligase [Chlamydiae bacterium]|nr:Histidine--tRNA ligase [Chlamydiota bacterium]
MHYRIAKGVFDILPQDPDPQGNWRETHLWHFFEKTMREVALAFGYEEIRTPIFETTDLFTRSIGSSSDIVTKEMYTFRDKGNRSLTLRPEGTAPVLRSFIEKSLHNQGKVHKFFYSLPMFRYERQQAGRYRQHHQFGVEAIGIGSPFQDVECIHLLWTLYQRLGLQNLTLHIHSLGNEETRKAFRHALKIYLRPHVNSLSAESQLRYETNPLRILDSKDAKDQKILEEAPKILDFLGEDAKDHFNTVCALLNDLKIPYLINPKLVRGLDYYNQTVFEITASELGAQNSLGGGGRYDGLIQQLGGPDLPAFGFGAGIERILITMLGQNVPFPKRRAPTLFLIPLGEDAAPFSFTLGSHLRTEGISVEIDLSGKKLKNAMKAASQKNAAFVAVIGDDEKKSGKFQLKNMQTGTVETVSSDELANVLQTYP